MRREREGAEGEERAEKLEGGLDLTCFSKNYSILNTIIHRVTFDSGVFSFRIYASRFSPPPFR